MELLTRFQRQHIVLGFIAGPNAVRTEEMVSLSFAAIDFRVSLSFAAGPDAVREEEAGKDDEKAGKSNSQILVGFLL